MKPCGDCPFMKNSPLNGSVEWMEDVFNFYRADKFFKHTCHKTDPKADGYNGAKKVMECAGHVQIMMNEMDKTPGFGGTYDSMEAMFEAYLIDWLGPEEYNKLKTESRGRKCSTEKTT